MVRASIDKPGRYYDAHRTIVLRTGLLLVEERRTLWHELRHAERRDQACHTDAEVERLVDRQAAEDAMPWCSLLAARERAADLDEMVELLKAPSDWVVARLKALHPARMSQLGVHF